MARKSARKTAKKTGGKIASARKKSARKKTTAGRKSPKASKKAPSRAVPGRRASRADAPEPILVPVGLVTTSFRLPPDLLGRLRLMATHRRNRLAKPYSQSSIVEHAIGEWLERNGS